VVFGILQTNTYGWGLSRVWLYVALGVPILAGSFVHARAREHSGSTTPVSIRLFRNRTSNLGLLTQNVKWLVLQGIFFVISAWRFWPGLFRIGFGIGTLLTASVNVLQSAWPEDVQGDISGVSRSVSNLGSSLGVPVGSSVLVAPQLPAARRSSP